MRFMVERLFLLRQWGTVIVPYSYFKEMDMKVTVIMEKASDGQAEEGKEVPELEFSYKYDMQSFFNYFSFLNVTKVAELAGINASLMRQYTSGVTTAGQKQYDKIRVAVERISKELSAATF